MMMMQYTGNLVKMFLFPREADN